MRFTVLVAVFVLVAAPTVAGGQIFDDLDAFLLAVESSDVAGFDDLPVGSMPPFVTNGVAIAADYGPEVIDEFFGSTHQDVFPGIGTPPNFMLTNFSTIEATFADDVDAAGFLFSCLACNINPFESEVNWQLLDAMGNRIDGGATAIDFSPDGQPGFFGVVSSTPFRGFRFNIADIGGGSYGNWFLDDVRSATVAIPVAPPEIPTLSAVGAALLSLLIGWAGLLVLRRR